MKRKRLLTLFLAAILCLPSCSAAEPLSTPTPGPLTRAMMAAVLYRAQGEPTVSGASSFTDVSPGQWYPDAVTWAGGYHFFSGDSVSGALSRIKTGVS